MASPVPVFVVSVLLLAAACFSLVVDENPGAAPAESSNSMCLSAGGICLNRTECDEEKISTSAQCSDGAVCCHAAFSSKETSCEKMLGMCRSDCNPEIALSQAMDCPEGTLCCPTV